MMPAKWCVWCGLSLFVQFLVVGLFAQRPPVIDEKLSPADYPYYFRIGQEIRDIRDFRVVNNQILQDPMSRVIIDPGGDGFLVAVGSRLVSKHRSDGSRIQRINLQPKDLLSSDMTHVVFVKEGDLWAADIDWVKGARTNERQITQLGIFPSWGAIRYSHWYRYTMILQYEESCYKLNTQTGNMVEFPYMCTDKLYWESSPSGRFIFSNNVLADLELEREFGLHNYQAGSPAVWISDTSFFLYQASHLTEPGVQKTIYVDAHTPFQYEYEPVDVIQRGWYDVYRRYEQGGYFSPGGRYFLYYKNLSPRYVNAVYELWVMDLQEETHIRTTAKIPENFGNLKNTKTFWTSDSTFVYGKEGNLVEQGLWLYDIHQQTEKRICSFLPRQFLRLPGSGMFLIIGNNQKIYRVRNDGGGFTEMPEQPYLQSGWFRPFTARQTARQE